MVVSPQFLRRFLPRRWHGALLSVVALFGAGIVTGFGGTVFTDDPGIQFVAGLVGSAVASMLVVVVFYFRTEERMDEIASSLSLLALGFDLTVLPPDGSNAPLESLLRNLAQYHHDRVETPHFLRELIDDSLQQTTRMLETRSSGRTVIAWEEVRSRAIKVFEEAKKGDSLYTTSYVYTPVWWWGTGGRNYMVKKRDAAGRGAQIVQIFISPDADSLKADDKVILELAKPVTGPEPQDIVIYAIREDALPDEEKRDVLLLKRDRESLGFELDLRQRTLPQGFMVFHGDSETEKLAEYFNKLLSRQPVRFVPSQYHDFADFVNEVFRR